eukprot:2771098-Prymnesium_polylepis.2
MLAGHWNARGRNLDHYKEMANDVITERVDIHSASVGRQAAAVIEWVRAHAPVPPVRHNIRSAH